MNWLDFAATVVGMGAWGSAGYFFGFRRGRGLAIEGVAGGGVSENAGKYDGVVIIAGDGAGYFDPRLDLTCDEFVEYMRQRGKVA